MHVHNQWFPNFSGRISFRNIRILLNYTVKKLKTQMKTLKITKVIEKHTKTTRNNTIVGNEQVNEVCQSNF